MTQITQGIASVGNSAAVPEQASQRSGDQDNSDPAQVIFEAPTSTRSRAGNAESPRSVNGAPSTRLSLGDHGASGQSLGVRRQNVLHAMMTINTPSNEITDEDLDDILSHIESENPPLDPPQLQDGSQRNDRMTKLRDKADEVINHLDTLIGDGPRSRRGHDIHEMGQARDRSQLERLMQSLDASIGTLDESIASLGNPSGVTDSPIQNSSPRQPGKESDAPLESKRGSTDSASSDPSEVQVDDLEDQPLEYFTSLIDDVLSSSENRNDQPLSRGIDKADESSGRQSSAQSNQPQQAAPATRSSSQEQLSRTAEALKSDPVDLPPAAAESVHANASDQTGGPDEKETTAKADVSTQRRSTQQGQSAHRPPATASSAQAQSSPRAAQPLNSGLGDSQQAKYEPVAGVRRPKKNKPTTDPPSNNSHMRALRDHDGPATTTIKAKTLFSDMLKKVIGEIQSVDPTSNTVTTNKNIKITMSVNDEGNFTLKLDGTKLNRAQAYFVSKNFGYEYDSKENALTWKMAGKTPKDPGKGNPLGLKLSGITMTKDSIQFFKD